MSCDFIANIHTLRATKVDECGTPVPGDENAFVTGCIATLAMNPNVDTQDDKIYRAANGSICAYKAGCSTLLNYAVELNIQAYSPNFLSVLTGGPEVLDANGEVIGHDDCSIQCTAGYGLEFWAELIDPTCSTATGRRWLYGLLPWINNSYISDLELGSEAVTFQLNGNTAAGGGWGVGPYDVVNGAGGTPGPMLTPLGTTCHRRMFITTVQPPAASCDNIAVPTPTP